MNEREVNRLRKLAACKCGCEMDAIDFELVELYSNLVHYLHSVRKSLIITSWNRCSKYNEQLRARGYKPSKKSQHLKGKAMDLSGSSDSMKKAYDYLCATYGSYGFILHADHLHVDVRSRKYRKNYTTKGK